MQKSTETALVPDDELSLEAAYQKRIFRYLVFIGSPFIITYGIVLLLLSGPAYIMGLYILSVAIMGVGFAVLMRPMSAPRFLRIYRIVSTGYVAALLTVQVISIAVFNRAEFSAWILLYPSMVFLFMSKKDALSSVVVCGLAFFVPLFFAEPISVPPASILSMKANLLLVFVLVAVCTYFIENTRRRFQANLVRKQQELMKMKQTAEAASRAKSEFLSNMSHELRTPLNHIIGFTELLLESSAERRDGTSVEYLTDVLTSGRHLLHLVNDVLDLARVEEGKLELNLRPVAAGELLDRSMKLVGDRARDKNIALLTGPDIPAETFNADASRLTQVLVNLLVNAVKFTPAGGRVTASCRIVEETAADGRMVEFSVTDSGAGIPTEMLPLLFERFSRLERPEYRGEEGVGLGLALSKELVARHGGRIMAESQGAGAGSTFRFAVPMH
jgi:signal transduction histidine kinase